MTTSTPPVAPRPRFAPPTGLPMRANMDTVTSNRPAASLGRGVGFLYLLSGPITMALFIVSVVGLGLIPITVGIGLLALSVPATRWIANRHRDGAARLLGEPVPAAYRPDREGNWLSRLAGRAKDPQNWRDLIWLLVSCTVGWTLALLAVSFLLAIPWYLIQPLLMGVTDGVFDTNYGIFHVESVADSFLQWVLVVPAFLLWWYVAPLLMQLVARIDRALLGPTADARVRLLEQRVESLTGSRSDAVDIQAAELRRIERDLHDGAQARLVSSGMTLGMALDAIERDPEMARQLLQEAQVTNRDALADLRSVVRGIHPPVLADRGLVGAVEALAVQLPTPTTVASTLEGRLPAPLESALYFAVAECLANIGKHAAARSTMITFSRGEGTVTAVVIDDGRGGAHIDPAGGLAGIARRLAVFDGTVDITSPAGGPTRVTLTVPA
jgi:signal transduction histidine kinase